jgi:hypothetical protein
LAFPARIAFQHNFSDLANLCGVDGAEEGVQGRERDGGVGGGVEKTLLRSRLVPAGSEEDLKRLEENKRPMINVSCNKAKMINEK